MEDKCRRSNKDWGGDSRLWNISRVTLSLWLLLFVNVNVNLYSALSHSASNALGAPSTAETDAS